MNELLAKFAAVEIRSRDRLSPEDIQFCEHQQAAYESALSGYKELSVLWSKMAAIQMEHTGSDNPEDNKDYSGYDSTIVRNYLSSEKGAWLSVEAIQNHVAALHRLFLEVLVHYFNETYHLSLTKTEARRAFLPRNPGYGAVEEEWAEYREKTDQLHLTAEAFVDWMLDSFDGRRPSEQAVFELKQRCHEAVWDRITRDKCYERSKATIRFNGYFCRTYSRDCLKDEMKNILEAAAYYEAGAFVPYPYGIDRLMNSDLHVYEDTVEFPDCEKLLSLRMFKNGRCDLKFTSPEYAEAFAAEYLGKDY